jgi:GLPGLI family protein
MNTIKKTIFVLSLCFFSGIFAQQNKKTIKISYNAYPTSTRDMPPPTSRYFNDMPAIMALGQSYKYKYSLLVDAETGQSIYKFDNLIRENVPAGQEKTEYTVNDKTDFVIKEKGGVFYKQEMIFQREFYSQGDNKEIEWTITNETKTISGLKCTKAISKKEEFMLTVWFTEDISVASGPSYFLNLPGLVVWAEDFFWTIELEKVEEDGQLNFNAEMDKMKKTFNDKKKDKSISEALLLVKKAELVDSMIQQMKE